MSEVVFPLTGKQVIPLRDLDQEQVLQAFADSLLPLFDNMPSVKIRVCYDPHFDISPAQAFWRWREETIYVRPTYKRFVGWFEVFDLLKHELCHAYVARKGLSTLENAGHNEAWMQMAIKVQCDLKDVFLYYPATIKLHDRITRPHLLTTLFLIIYYFMVTKCGDFIDSFRTCKPR